jgi:hypothetical protein
VGELGSASEQSDEAWGQHEECGVGTDGLVKGKRGTGGRV